MPIRQPLKMRKTFSLEAKLNKQFFPCILTERLRCLPDDQWYRFDILNEDKRFQNRKTYLSSRVKGKSTQVVVDGGWVASAKQCSNCHLLTISLAVDFVLELEVTKFWGIR